MRAKCWAALAVAALAGVAMFMRMPGKSYRGPIPEPNPQGAALATALHRDVERLARQIGERNVIHYEQLTHAAAFIEGALRAAGYEVRRQPYEVGGRSCENLEAERRGVSRPEEIVVLGAHYDSVLGSPGANDNASGVAALLALARASRDAQSARTVRFIAFVNEEPPHFQTAAMGSLVYARRSRQRGERIIAMLSLETMGYYTDRPGSQQYPFPFNLFYPSTGNFIGFISDLKSRALVRRCVASFRAAGRMPSEGVAAFASIPGVGWSDQWAFWQQGYPAAMVTDTALFRSPYYHTAEDTPEKLDYQRLALVVQGLEAVVQALARPSD